AVGVLVQGVSCVLFQTDAGKRFVLDNLDGFGPGDKVRVSGELVPDCNSVCQEGDGCIHNNTITSGTTTRDQSSLLGSMTGIGLCGTGMMLVPMLLGAISLRFFRRDR